MIELHNAVIDPNDNVWCLGDFGFCSAKQTIELLDRLNGNLHLIIGNHDKQFQKSEVKRKLEWMGYYHELRGFSKLGIPLIHFPFESWNRQHHGAIHFHGHAHGNGVDFGRRKDVGIDTNYGSPYHLPTLVEEMEKREIVNDGGHHKVREV